jgi:hypothetical protein
MASHAESGVFDRIRHFWCALHGHDMFLQFRQDRMFLACVSCGHQSPGWELNEARPVVSLRTERAERSLAVARPRLISARRVA